MTPKKKKIVTITSIFTGIFIICGVTLYLYIDSVISTRFNIDEKVSLYIGSEKSYDKLIQDLITDARIENIDNFERLADVLKYRDNLKTGHYIVEPEMTALELVRKLRSGSQDPIRLTFNNIRTKEDFVVRISEQLMFSEAMLSPTLNDSLVYSGFGLSADNFVAMFIPNTYEVYWDMTPIRFLEKMQKEYVSFWNEKRKAKAEEIGLTPVQVSILASIVEEECTFADEYPIVAGLYLNRLRRGQLLQADPTVKFAVGDFSITRVLNKHLETDSPYNTYIYKGLPPGPIRIPSIKGIESVLNYQKSDYLYMCAKEDFSGRHNFAKTLAEHNRNAGKYRAALNRLKIYQ